MVESVPNIASPLVFIGAAGIGSRMGKLTANFNKALLPIGDVAVITQIIDSFPKDSRFVIALGYQASKVKEYLKQLHKDRELVVVTVDDYQSPISGPGLTVLQCRQYLKESFFYISCDTLFSSEMLFNVKYDQNWIHLSKSANSNIEDYTSAKTDSRGKVKKMFFKQKTDSRAYPFSGLAWIKDFSLFFEAIEKSINEGQATEMVSGLTRLMELGRLNSVFGDWIDVGTEEKYVREVQRIHEYDFSKTDEYIYFYKGRVTKYFGDEEIAKKRFLRAGQAPGLFPEILEYEKNFFSYKMIPGINGYDGLKSPRQLESLLNQLEKSLWLRQSISKIEARSAAMDFYKTKTLKRLEQAQQKVQSWERVEIVNGVSVQKIDEILNKISWDEIVALVEPVLFHGDLQFDNILVTQSGFKLIDWRQDFGGRIDFGDLYYDLAKLHGGLLFNYKEVKKGQLKVSFNSESEVILQIPQAQNLQDLLSCLYNWISNKGLQKKNVGILTGLIYLNMAPLHHPPFDGALFWKSKVMLGALCK
ncbi:MAG: phosphotransferase [Proteobacteria bacterium]|jgi:choline kinase/thiamine kinase-like enzyme|nr:phosphotransferase [Pseudomonadota bacterium]